MANFTKESHQNNPNQTKNDDSATGRNQIHSSEKIHDMFQFSSPNNQQTKFTKPTCFVANSPDQNSRYLVTQASPAHHTMLSKSTSKTIPEKRSIKKSEDYVFQKSRSTSLYSRSKKSTKGGIENEYEEHKVSIFNSPLKSKWLFVLLGVPPKIPTDAVELKTDIKNRQSRRGPSTFFPIHVGDGGCEEVVPEDSPRPKASEKRKKSMLGSCFGTAGPVQI